MITPDAAHSRLSEMLNGLLEHIGPGGPNVGRLMPQELFAAALIERYCHEGRVVELSDWLGGQAGSQERIVDLVTWRSRKRKAAESRE